MSVNHSMQILWFRKQCGMIMSIKVTGKDLKGSRKRPCRFETKDTGVDETKTAHTNIKALKDE